MRRVPHKRIFSDWSGVKSRQYLLVGSGRLARHLACYFDHTSLQYLQWSRNNDPLFNSEWKEYPDPEKRWEHLIAQASHVVLLIKDEAIGEFYHLHPELKDKVCIHCSGTFQHPEIHSAHPLMTFGPQLYASEVYEEMAFVTEVGCLSFHQLFPQLANKSYMIPVEEKAFYHCLCVMAGNFTTLLWQQVEREMQSRLGLPLEAIEPYKLQVFRNTLENAQSSLTGPLVRGDYKTISAHLDTLSNHPLREVYKSFVELYQSSHPSHSNKELSYEHPGL